MSDLPVTFTNGGGATTGALTTARSGDAQFSIQADTCNAATVAPAGTCTVTVRFAPIATRAVTGTLTVTGDPGGPVAVQLTGIGRSKLYELIAAGEVDVVKIGASTLITVASLRRLIQKSRR